MVWFTIFIITGYLLLWVWLFSDISAHLHALWSQVKLHPSRIRIRISGREIIKFTNNSKYLVINENT